MSSDRLLFIHGWATDSWTWKTTAALLDVQPVFMTLPGHGSDSQWNESTLAPGIMECNRLLHEEAPRSVIGVGWSIGGQILLASAMADPSRFKALILVGATPRFVASADFPIGQSPALVRRIIKDMRKDAASTLKRFYRLNFTDEEMKAEPASDFIKRYEYPGPIECNTTIPGCFPAFKYAEIAASLEAIYSTDLRSGLSNIDLPTLIIHGASDTVTSVNAGKFLAEHIKDSRLVIFEDIGHAPHITQPDKFAQTVNAFIEQL
ncbi:MAG: hypothetical protein A3J24_11985 [Deltaproteobacteria bacterium RIFCSPLOWO2_02_FULL_53_8]|nr:MAG: hypothetical protein A3J24_11985 [Deltaproteobacteria bacterium RIFCSPLOWO2_02_FULL_53_8]